MGLQINIGDHTSSEADWIAFPRRHLGNMRWARQRARVIAAKFPSANVYFRALPGRRTLTQLMEDRSIWVNYHPTATAFGITNAVGGKEIAISERACRIGRWTMLATLIHELAHSNGAPGDHDRRAEEALLACGLGKPSEKRTGKDDPFTPYEPGIEG